MVPVAFPKYNIWGAVLVEALRQLINVKPSLSTNKFVVMAIDFWFQDWVSWKTSKTMDSVDQQIEAIQKMMVKNDKPSTTFTETKEGETPLGGEMRIRSNWVVSDT